MPSELTNIYADGFLDWLCKGSPMPTNPTVTGGGGLWMGLMSAMPGADGTNGTEVTSSFRAAGRRKILTSEFAVASNRENSVSMEINLGQPPAGGVTCVGIVFFDQQTGGNEVAFGTLSQGSILSDTAKETAFPAGSIILKMKMP